MPAWRSFRLLWVALIPVLVFPLYGQTSCNRSCPPSSNPCQRSAGRSIETSQCIYTDINGAICDLQGVDGICYEGQCLPADCQGIESYDTCSTPLSGEFEGACVGDICVTAAPVDTCVQVGAGRINCCWAQGCLDSDGMFCTDPRPDDTPCDPTGIEAPGDPSQTGLCDNGTCVAQSGLCAGVVCRVDSEDSCRRNDCNSSTGECELFPVQPFLGCTSSGFDAFCNGGICTAENVSGPCGINCLDGNSCTYDLCVEDLFGNPFQCRNPNKPTGSSCEINGSNGQCLFGVCQPVITSECQHEPNDPNRYFPECDDGEECTYDRCDFANQCTNPDVFNGTSCAFGAGLCAFGDCLILP